MGSIFWRRTLTTGSLASVAVLLSGLIALSPSGAQAANVVPQPAEITVVADDGEGDHPETTAEDGDGGEGGEADHPETLADGGFPGELPARGYGFVVAEGGTVSQLHRALVRAGADLAAVTEGGKVVVYLPEAQAADNQAFVDLFRDSIPAGRLMIVRIRGEAAIATGDPAAYTKLFVDEAINRYDEEGRDATVAYYNSPVSVDGEWYVFIADENDVVIARATVPAVVGDALSDPKLTDVNGVAYGVLLSAATAEGIWVDYIYVNPARDDADEVKHSWAVRYEGLLFGSGWYERTP